MNDYDVDFMMNNNKPVDLKAILAENDSDTDVEKKSKRLVKIFKASDVSDLNQYISDFLQDHTLIDIKLSSVENYNTVYYTVAIIYE